VLRLTALTELDVAGNELSTLPADFFSFLSGLEVLDLSRNALSCLPDGIAACTNLRILSLGDNPLSSLPRAIVKLPHLSELYLRYAFFVFQTLSFAKYNLIKMKISETVSRSIMT
jgi:Leucine-rich repeat (LRR) protein